MRPAQKARRRLRGNWLTAIAVQCARLGAGISVLLTEIAVLYLLGLGADQVVEVRALWNGGWLYGVVLLCSLLVDWLGTSPLLAGEAAYYRSLAAGEAPSFSLLFSFYRRGYGRAVGWRFALFLRRIGWGLLCYAPAALIAGYAELVRRGPQTPLADVTMLLCSLFGVAALAGGFVAREMLMLRYLPAVYLLADEGVRPAFRRARRIMRRRLGEAVSLYLGFAGWFASCLLVFPYFYVSPLFQTTRALVVRRFEREAPAEEAPAGNKAKRKLRRHGAAARP